MLTSTAARIRVSAAIAALISLPLLGAVALAAAGGLGAASSAVTRLEPRLLANPTIWIDESVQAVRAVVDDFAGSVAIVDPRLLANPVIVLDSY